jgi:hypothetical protein
MLAGIADFSTTGIANPDGGLDYQFEVIQTVHEDVANTRLLFRAFSVVPATARDMTVDVGMEIVNTKEEICFTTRPLMDWFLPKILYIQGLGSVNLDPRLADAYSMAPVGSIVNTTDGLEWVSYYCGSFGAKASAAVVYRSHSGGGGFMESSFSDQYYFISGGFFTSGVTPGCVVGGGVMAAAMPLTVSRSLGKNHSEDYGALGPIAALVTAGLILFSGGALAVAVGGAYIAGTLVSGMSFYEDMPSNTTLAKLYNNDQVMWIRS